MKCNEASEFVSDLCDGERIPPEAAIHIGECEACRRRWNEYLTIGAELKRMASASAPVVVPQVVWSKQRPSILDWWQMGRETMKISKLAFALLWVVIGVLGSTLTVVKVKARTQERALLLNVKTPDGDTSCVLSMEDKSHGSYGAVFGGRKVSGVYGFRFISKDDDRIQLGIRAVRGAQVPASGDEIDKQPEVTYWLQPGEELTADVPGGGRMTISGKELDRAPAQFGSVRSERLDPNPGDIRIDSPIVLRGKTVLYDFGDAGVTGSSVDGVVELCVPGDGCYEVSLAPLEGGVEGHISESRILFEMRGQPYQILTGAPIAQTERIWILHRSGGPREKGKMIGYVSMKEFLATTTKKTPQN